MKKILGFHPVLFRTRMTEKSTRKRAFVVSFGAFSIVEIINSSRKIFFSSLINCFFRFFNWIIVNVNWTEWFQNIFVKCVTPERDRAGKTTARLLLHLIYRHCDNSLDYLVSLCYNPRCSHVNIHWKKAVRWKSLPEYSFHLFYLFL